MIWPTSNSANLSNFVQRWSVFSNEVGFEKNKFVCLSHFLVCLCFQGMARVKQQQEGGRYLIGFTYGMYVAGCGEYLDILIYSNIFRYEYSFVSYSYHFLMQIYSDICSYCFFYTSIFGSLFVSFLDTQVSLATTHVSPMVSPSVSWSHCWISNLWSPHFFCTTSAKCTRLACLLSFASLFNLYLAGSTTWHLLGSPPFSK